MFMLNFLYSHWIMFRIVIFVLVIGFMAPSLPAQCPMCKASVESNLAKGETKGAGLNKGILFLLVIPYLAASAIGFAYYRNYRLRKKRQLELNSL
jgi:hypothetical protein